MKAIILAAGFGKRLMPLTEDRPKCLVKIEGKTILERMVCNCLPLGIVDYTIVVGHGKEEVLETLDQLQRKYRIKMPYIDNFEYANSNTGMSLKLALEHAKEDVLIINGDNVTDRRIIRNLLVKNSTAVVIDNVKVLNAESFKVRFSNHRIELMGKDIHIAESNGEFIGISMIKFEDLNTFRHNLDQLVECNKNVYYDLAFQQFSQDMPISFVMTDGLLWTEVDTIDDLNIARHIVNELRDQPDD